MRGATENHTWRQLFPSSNVQWLLGSSSERCGIAGFHNSKHNHTKYWFSILLMHKVIAQSLQLETLSARCLLSCSGLFATTYIYRIQENTGVRRHNSAEVSGATSTEGMSTLGDGGVNFSSRRHTCTRSDQVSMLKIACSHNGASSRPG